MNAVRQKISPSMGLAGVAALFIVCFCSLSFTQSESPRRQGPPTSSGDQTMVARGKYIVEGVARCAQCHTPRNDQGEDHSQWLEGAAVWLQPAHAVEDWPQIAPRLAGNPPGTDAEMVTLLTTGVWRDGKQLRQPMPQFRMTVEDARAVVAYLKSLGPQH
jgi:mono/diheme cytochrome c family protein